MKIKEPAFKRKAIEAKFTREGKTDFTEHFKKHREVMAKHGCNVD